MSVAPINFSALSGLSSEDQLLFAKFGVGESQSLPFDCVHHAFEHFASVQPDAVAVEHLADTITYSELNRKANGLANLLRDSGVRPGSRVCLLVQRSIPMVIGILAILKAGGQYIPLDGGIVTQSTLDFVLEDSCASHVLCLQEFAHRVAATDTRRVTVLEKAIAQFDDPESNCRKPDDLAMSNDGVYVIYTSGTW